MSFSSGFSRIELLDVITVLSFVLQLENNDELKRQTTNDEILKTLHDDVMFSLEDNRKLCSKIIEQNNEILKVLEEVKSIGKI